MTDKRKKELKRVKQFIRRAEKRGYKFNDEFKKSISTRSTRSLQLLTARKIYEQSTYTLPSREQYSGLTGRYLEREAASIKGAITRQMKREAAKKGKGDRFDEGADFGYLPNMEDIVYQNVMALIEQYPSSEGSQYLKNLLDSEISSYGKSMVARAMQAANEDLIKAAQEIIFYELNSWQMNAALKAFSEVIRGGITLTKEESRKLSMVMEGTEYNEG